MRLALLLVLALAHPLQAGSGLPLIPDVRRASMTGESLPAAWNPAPDPSNPAGFAEEVARLAGPGDRPTIPLRLAVDAAVMPSAEGYRLEIGQDGIRVTGADAAGIYYGLKTLRQLVALHPSGAPCGVIEDAPAFAVRGLMHDTGRNFQPVALIKAQLDRLADYKINTFHWHLTDHPGWRIECKAYPILNHPSTRLPERDPDATYSYEEIREVIAYAKARHIRVIPELDMPGHSAYFKKAFGFDMGDPRAMPILKALIAEFCAEIPAADCPILHIGSDEVRIADPAGFIRAIGAEVRAHGRTPMLWNPGLPNDGTAIDQLWKDADSAKASEGPRAGLVDSSLGYLNGYDPAQMAQRHLFLQLCRVPRGDAARLGGITCVWPDIRVVDKSRIAALCGVWPGALGFAQASWTGRETSAEKAAVALPAPDSPLGREYAAFEARLARHRDTFFAGEAFPFVRSGHIVWRTIGPFPSDQPLSATPEGGLAESYPVGAARLRWKTAHGGVIPVDFHVPVPSGPSSSPGKPTRVPGVGYALTYVHAERDVVMRVQVGFETPTRSNRMYAGIPPTGSWDANGGAVFVNDAPAPAPAWKSPGTRRLMRPSWAAPEELIPIDDEELYWMREPASIALKAGWNKILVKLPAGHPGRRSSFAFLPVRQDATGRWVEDLSVRFAVEPGSR